MMKNMHRKLPLEDFDMSDEIRARNYITKYHLVTGYCSGI